MMVVEHWHKLPTEIVTSPSLEVLKTQLYKAQQPDLTSKLALHSAEGWTTRLPEIQPEFFHNSMIYDSSQQILCHYVVEKMVYTFTRGMFQAVSTFLLKFWQMHISIFLKCN